MQGKLIPWLSCQNDHRKPFLQHLIAERLQGLIKIRFIVSFTRIIEKDDRSFLSGIKVQLRKKGLPVGTACFKHPRILFCKPFQSHF